MKHTFNALLFGVLLFLSAVSIKAQDTEFWMAPVSSVSRSSGSYGGNGGFMISNPSNQEATVRIHYFMDGTEDVITVDAGGYNLYTYATPTIIRDKGLEIVKADMVGTPVSGGAHITSDVPIFVYYIYDYGAVQESVVLKGKGGVGKSFHVGHADGARHQQLLFGSVANYPNISIIATEDNTTVTFSVPENVTNYTAGTHSATLNKGQFLILRTITQTGFSLKGSIVTSDKPISVLSGEESFGTTFTADLCADQLVRDDFAGTTYIFTLSAGYNYMTNASNRNVVCNYLDIIALEDDTEVFINWGNGKTSLGTIDKGETLQTDTFRVNRQNACATITSTKPIHCQQLAGREASVCHLPNFYATSTNYASFFSYMKNEYDSYAPIYPAMMLVYKESGEDDFRIKYPLSDNTIVSEPLFDWITQENVHIDSKGDVPEFTGWKYIRFTLPDSARNRMITLENSSSVFQLGFTSSFAAGTNLSYFSAFSQTFEFSPDTIYKCAGEPHTLTGGIADMYTWKHPDGTTQSGATLNSLTVTKEGLYTLTMKQGINTVISTCQVIDLAFQADVTPTNSFIESGDIIHFSINNLYPLLQSPPGSLQVKYTWDFGTGATPATSTSKTPPGVQWTTTGPHIISLHISAESTLQEGVGCDTTIYAVLYGKYPDNISEADCYIEPPGTPFTFTELVRSSNSDVHTLTTPVCGDIDNDGKIEIIVPQSSGTVSTSNLFIYEMDPATNQLTLQQTLATPKMLSEGGASYSIAKVDDNDYAAIFLATNSIGNAVAADKMQLIKYTFNGTQYVESARQPYSTTNRCQAPTPVIVDFNGDGIAEVAVYDKVYNAKTMTLLANGGYISDLSKGFGEGGHPNDSEPTVSSGSFMVAADVDGDGLPEFIGGNCVYKVTITNASGITGNSFVLWSQCDRTDIVGNPHLEAYDGATAVADFDGDGKLDVVVTTRADKNASNVGNGALYIWNPRTGKVMNRNLVNTFLPHSTISRTASGPSVPFVGDIDNDGEPEICLTARSMMYAYEYNASTGQLTLKWSKATTDTSAATTMVLFDFNQDGTSELVYRDLSHLRIINGLDGNDLITPIACSSATGSECPIVADVNGDGSAEILVTGGLSGSNAWTGYLRIFSSNPAGVWAPARKVWNQFQYNAVNINEDLTVPKFQLNPAVVFPGKDGILGTADDVRPYNAFLQQQTILDKNGLPVWLTPDGWIIGDWFNYDVEADSITITVDVYNDGDAAFQAPFYITTYQNNVGSSLKYTYTYNHPILPGDTVSVTFGIPNFIANWHPFNNIIVQINDKGDGLNDQAVCDDSRSSIRTTDIIASDDRVLVFTDDVNSPIDITFNDILPSGCTHPVIQLLSVPSYTGTAAVSGSNIIYTPAAGAITDTLRYSIHCGDASKSDTATVYISIIEKIDNIVDADCYVTPPATTWSIKEVALNKNVLVQNYGPLVVGDIDNDGVVEIIGYKEDTRNSYNYESGGIKIFYYNSVTNLIELKNEFLFSATGGSTSATFGAMAIARYNNTGYIVVAGTDKYLYAYSPTGARLWKSNVQYQTPYSGTLVGIADFNNDGIPEVYTGNQIFSLSNGILLCDGGTVNSSGLFGSAAGHASIAADMNGDGTLELVAGVNIYHVTITNNGGTVGNSIGLLPGMQLTQTLPANAAKDGATQVVDIDHDGILEVVVLSLTGGRTVVYVWKPLPNSQSYIMGSYLVPATGVGYYSVPMLGNIDNDPYPEIVFITNGSILHMHALKFNPTAAVGSQLSLKWNLLHTDGSGCTGATLFDFNQDGRNEIVYRDQTDLRIIDGSGSAANVMATFNNVRSGTLREYPIIADVDGDGQAEIIVTGGDGIANTVGGIAVGNQNGYIRLFKTNGSAWAPARKVWNQYAYNATNVNEDLTIPKTRINPTATFPGNDGLFGTADDVRPYNNFLQQQTLLSKKGTPIWLTPDVYPDPSLVNSSVIGDSVSITIGMINQGDAAIGLPVYVSLYKETLAAGNIFATDSTNIQILPGDTGYVTVRIANMQLHLPITTIVVRVNDDGTNFTDFVHQPECDETNNVITILNPAMSLMMKKDATLQIVPAVQHNGEYGNPVSILHSETVQYEITAVNANQVTGTVIIRDTLPPYMDYSSSTPSATTVNMISGNPQRTEVVWSIGGVAPMASTSVQVVATPAMGSCASQAMFINRAWVTTSDTIFTPTNYTYHQGACVGIATFSAGFGGQIYNATEQALDYRTSPRAGIVVVPEEGYRFKGWSHDDYLSLRSETIRAQSGIMHYDTLTVYGNVNLRAEFELESYPIRYHLNGGRNAAENPKNYSIETETITLAVPSKAGDEFIGWTGSNGDTPQTSVVIPEGSTGELEFYANFLRSGCEKEIRVDEPEDDKIWAAGNDLYIRTSKIGSMVRVYSVEGMLVHQQEIQTAGETKIKLLQGIYIVTLNNDIGKKIRID